MEIVGAAGLVGVGAAYFNRANFLYDMGQQQTLKFKKAQFHITKVGQYRDDINDLLKPIVSLTGNLTKISGFMLLIAIFIIGPANLPNGVEPFMRTLTMANVVAAICFLFLCKWMAFHAMVSAQVYHTKLMLQNVRLPIPTKEELHAAVRRASEFEQLPIKDILRMPVLQHEQKRSNSEPNLRDVLHDEDLEKEKDQLDHIKLFRQLRLQWRSYEVYTRICLAIGTYSFLQALCFYCTAYFAWTEQVIGGWSLTLVLTVLAWNILELDMFMQTLLLGSFALGPLLAAAYYSILPFQVTTPYVFYLIPVIFLVQTAWPIIFIWITRTNGSSSFRFVHFIDVFQTYGGKRILNTHERAIFEHRSVLKSLKKECLSHKNNKTWSAADRLQAQDFVVDLTKALNSIAAMLPTQKAPFKKEVPNFTSSNISELKRNVNREIAVLHNLRLDLVASNAYERQDSMEALNLKQPTRNRGAHIPYKAMQILSATVALLYLCNTGYQTWIMVDTSQHRCEKLFTKKTFLLQTPRNFIYCCEQKVTAYDPKICQRADRPIKSSRRRRALLTDSPSNWGPAPPNSLFYSCNEDLQMHNRTHLFSSVGSEWRVIENSVPRFSHCTESSCLPVSEGLEDVKDLRLLTPSLEGKNHTHFHVLDTGRVFAYHPPSYIPLAEISPLKKPIRASVDTSRRNQEQGNPPLLAILGASEIKLLNTKTGAEEDHSIAIVQAYNDICIHDDYIYLLTHFSEIIRHTL